MTIPQYFQEYKWMEVSENIEMNRIQEEIRSLLLSSGANLMGFADISDQRFPNRTELKSAIAVGIAYDSKVIDKLDSEVDAFEKHQMDTRKRMDELLEACDQFLERNGFVTWIPPGSKNLPGLIGDFSYKMAATKAGLGWVGKSSLFISPRFGCGLRLGSVLTNASFVPGNPVTVSRCGDCVECMKACPHGAIKGANWYPEIGRDELIDVFLCSRKREESIPVLGYKHPCGLCIQACPIGRKPHQKGDAMSHRGS